MIKKQFVPAKKRTRSVVILIVVLALIFSIPILRDGLRRTFGAIGMGVVRVFYSSETSTGNFFESLRYKSSLVNENKRLQDKISNMSALVSEHDQLVRENLELKTAMNRGETMQFTLASILQKPPVSPYDTLLIDGGSSVGIAIGDIIFANGETQIGEVSSVFPHSATVKLYSSPGEKTDARLDPSHLDIELTGDGGGNFSATVPHDLVVENDSMALSKDINPRIIAQLKKITSDPREPFQTLLFSSPINMNQLSFVEVSQN